MLCLAYFNMKRTSFINNPSDVYTSRNGRTELCYLSSMFIELLEDLKAVCTHAYVLRVFVGRPLVISMYFESCLYDDWKRSAFLWKDGMRSVNEGLSIVCWMASRASVLSSLFFSLTWHADTSVRWLRRHFSLNPDTMNGKSIPTPPWYSRSN